MRQEVIEIIYRSIERENTFRDVPITVSNGEYTPIYGASGQMDSIGLVSLVMDVEHEAEQCFGLSISLVSEHAMSPRQSPFATIGSFADYVSEIVREASNV